MEAGQRLDSQSKDWKLGNPDVNGEWYIHNIKADLFCCIYSNAFLPILT